MGSVRSFFPWCPATGFRTSKTLSIRSILNRSILTGG
jgi:hypothetical protein